MKFHRNEISLSTNKRMEILEVTANVKKVIDESGIKNGFVNLWVPHSTAAITVNEYDTDLWQDILATFKKFVPIKADYRHNAKYGWNAREQNAHAHILSSIIKPGETIQLENGKMQLGTWQSILFIEMDGSRTRRIRIQVMGE